MSISDSAVVFTTKSNALTSAAGEGLGSSFTDCKFRLFPLLGGLLIGWPLFPLYNRPEVLDVEIGRNKDTAGESSHRIC